MLYQYRYPPRGVHAPPRAPSGGPVFLLNNNRIIDSRLTINTLLHRHINY